MQIAQQALHSLVYLRRNLGAGKVLRKISRLRRFAVIATHSAIRQSCCQPLAQPVHRLLIAKTDHHFRRLHSVNLLRDIQKCFLAFVKKPFTFACRNISCSKAQLMSCKLLQKDKITVMLILQKLLVQRCSRRNNLNNLTLDNALRQLRVLDLLTDGNTEALLNQLGDIAVDRMIGHAAHRNIVVAGALRQRNIQNLRCCNRIIIKHFVKIT